MLTFHCSTETLLQLFTWIPLNKFLAPRLIELIFQFIMFNEEISILAFSCVNEVLGNNQSVNQLMGALANDRL